ncbi:MAG: hypothetical protein HP491_03215 [Nitrospira sp.]|nr:hypothetical protein [Nitrospira sp.]
MASPRTIIGILVGGGPAPGINSVISAATIRGLLGGCDVLGILDGFKWLMEGSQYLQSSPDQGPGSMERWRLCTGAEERTAEAFSQPEEAALTEESRVG